MVVMHVQIWPGGDQARARTFAIATMALVEESEGVRTYEVRLLKDTRFGGPNVEVPAMDPDLIEQIVNPSAVFRAARVTGHRSGARGVWDLIGGVLKVMLGNRLSSYAAARRDG